MIYEFIFLLGGICLGLVVRDFLPSYMKEKAKNLATKEDISKITNIVKKVEFKFDMSLVDKEAHNSLLVESLNEYNRRRSKLPFDILDKGQQLYLELYTYRLPIVNYDNIKKIDFGDELLDESKKLYSELKLLQSMSDHLYNDSPIKHAISEYCNPLYACYSHFEHLRLSLKSLKNDINSDRLFSRPKMQKDDFYDKQKKIFGSFLKIKSSLKNDSLTRYDNVMREIIVHYESIEKALKSREEKIINETQ